VLLGVSEGVGLGDGGGAGINNLCGTKPPYS
jgi:hypothetical protein